LGPFASYLGSIVLQGCKADTSLFVGRLGNIMAFHPLDVDDIIVTTLTTITINFQWNFRLKETKISIGKIGFLMEGRC